VVLVRADATSRFALMDVDWERVKAVDLLVVLRSFAPSGGLVKTVSVYPSDFGIARMAQEKKIGPMAVMRQELKEAGIHTAECVPPVPHSHSRRCVLGGRLLVCWSALVFRDGVASATDGSAEMRDGSTGMMMRRRRRTGWSRARTPR
jgi:hypothetical protein